jgi:aldehyde:ferredoxin oxidoreductase
MGKILKVNMSNGQITKEPLQEESAHKYVGGRGFTISYLYEALNPGIDPLGPKNVLVFAPGRLAQLAEH